jgi:hypothetical protein
MNLPQTVVQAAQITIKGMLGLFLFMGMFYLILKLLMKTFPDKPVSGELK